ncbi:protein CASPARIAN STRIP INTEGRITY FACTOR 2-like [Ricinus communis]|uniref:protein CASPARIAN STRIP INTEGRITY FACTOR 2-like n=1 Tax=Ricinus communis TaxID=3988 RepID=UPI00201B1BC8|nr:protein CASPARIAN STRIP INTEGRITY FACTOR 2-like [Ricinus communis]
MGLMLLIKKFSLLFLLISVPFFSTSFAGRSKFVDKLADPADANYEELSSNPSHNDEATIIQERLLRANTKDYGHYDPAPALVRPPFKLIPN